MDFIFFNVFNLSPEKIQSKPWVIKFNTCENRAKTCISLDTSGLSTSLTNSDGAIAIQFTQHTFFTMLNLKEKHYTSDCTSSTFKISSCQVKTILIKK